jgi:acyl carrier protein
MTATPGTNVSASGIRQYVAGIVEEVLETRPDPGIDLFDQGATSLAFIRIVAKVNARYGITVDVAALEEASVDSLSALVNGQLNGEHALTARD